MSQYPGKYLETEPFELRYKIVAEFLKNKIDNPIVVDLNCGEPLFSKHIQWKEYHANDVFVPDYIPEGMDFKNVSDDKIDQRSDLLVMFGCSAGEYTEHPMESNTATKTLLRLAEYNPKYIVIESSPEWEKRYGYITKLIESLNKYTVVLDKTIEIPPAQHYHDTRRILIFKAL